MPSLCDIWNYMYKINLSHRFFTVPSLLIVVTKKLPSMQKCRFHHECFGIWSHDDERNEKSEGRIANTLKLCSLSTKQELELPINHEYWTSFAQWKVGRRKQKNLFSDRFCTGTFNQEPGNSKFVAHKADLYWKKTYRQVATVRPCIYSLSKERVQAMVEYGNLKIGQGAREIR